MNGWIAENKTLEDLRLTYAARAEISLNTQRSVARLEGAVFGNGKAGLTIRMDRIEQWMKDVPNMVEEKVRIALADIKDDMLSTAKVRAIVQEETEKERPGSWVEFRKTWLFPVIMMVVQTIVTGYLAYIVVNRP